MKKIITKLTLMTIFFLLAFTFTIDSKNINIVEIENKTYLEGATTTKYYDWSDITTLDYNYSYSSVYLSKDTEFKILKEAGDITWNSIGDIKVPAINNIGKNKELIMLITKCAVNKNGDLLDVLVKINNIHLYDDDGYVILNVNTSMQILNSQDKPSNNTKVIYFEIGSPINFGLGTRYASCDFNMTYYISGTYNYETNTGTLGNITSVNGYYGDIDVINSNANNYQKEIFKGNEGIRPNLGSSNIYYNKKGKQVSDNEFKNVLLQEIDNGIATKTKSESNTNGYWFATTALLLTNNISNSTFSFTYGGTNCGMSYMFTSPYPYDIPSPVKENDATIIRPGESFNYYISQYIPNNYYGTLLSYHEIYSNLYSDTRLSSLTISDQINNNLSIATKNIKIINELNEDVSSYFTISEANNLLTVTAKPEFFDKSEFYSHTYKIIIPVTLKENASNISSIINVAQTNASIDNKNFEGKSSNEVDIIIKYKIKVNYIDSETGEKIEESDIYEYENGAEYKTDRSKIGNEWELVEEPANASGKVTKDTEVNYYFKKVKKKVTVNYYDEETGEKIKESDIYEYEYGTEYTTDAPNMSDEWELVERPANASGVITEDLEVNYYFRRIKKENPGTGANANFIYIIVIMLGILSTFFIIIKQKIFKV